MTTYLDSSAAAKLLVEEAESATLAGLLDAAAARGERLVSCVLLETELRRLAHRLGVDQTAVTAVLAGVEVAELERAQYRTAGLLVGPSLGALDALYVAAALRLEADAVITYDHRLAVAAAAAGIRVLSPAG